MNTLVLVKVNCTKSKFNQLVETLDIQYGQGLVSATYVNKNARLVFVNISSVPNEEVLGFDLRSNPIPLVGPVKEGSINNVTWR